MNQGTVSEPSSPDSVAETPLLVSSEPAKDELESLFLQLGLHKLGGTSRSLVVCGVSSASGTTSVVRGLAWTADSVHHLSTVVVTVTRQTENSTTSVGSPGVCQLLDGRATINDVAQQTALAHLHEIPLGGAALPLAGTDLPGLLRALEAEYRLVLLDAAPVLRQRMTALLSAAAHGALLVVRHRADSRRQLARAAALIEGSGGTVQGAVLNRIKESLPSWIVQNR